MGSKNYLIGIDEVGRGPLAGPVTVAAILLSRNLEFSILNFQKTSGLKLRDSKKLSPRQRKIWADFIKKQKIPYATANIFPKTIDKINISEAANLAATRALNKIDKIISLKFDHFKKPVPVKIFLDGGLYLRNVKFKKLKTLNSKTIIKGDEKIPVIALSSIIAKVQRDKYMKKMGEKIPGYDFEKHKGYGTKKHYKLLKKNGISKIHRKSFLKNFTNYGLK